MLPPWLVHLINTFTYRNLPSFSSLFSLFSTYSSNPCHLSAGTKPSCQPSVSKAVKLTRSSSSRQQSFFSTCLNHRNSFPFDPQQPSLFHFCFSSSVLCPRPLPEDRPVHPAAANGAHAGSTIKAPRKMLHWKWCFILESQLFENQHGSVQNLFVSKTKLMSSPTIVLTLSFFCMICQDVDTMSLFYQRDSVVLNNASDCSECKKKKKTNSVLYP